MERIAPFVMLSLLVFPSCSWDGHHSKDKIKGAEKAPIETMATRFPKDYLHEMNKAAEAEWIKPTLVKQLPIIGEAEASTREFRPSWNFEILATPMPRHWPPNGNDDLTFYAYANARDITQLSDGEWIMSPWLRFNLSQKLTTIIESTAIQGPFRKLGIQGVRPITKNHEAYLSDEDAAQQLQHLLKMAAKRPPGPPKNLQRYYCNKILLHAVIMGDIKARHAEFFAWLDCN